MSERSLRRVLWLLIAITVPIPFFALQMAFAPALRLWFLTAIFCAVAATEQLRSGFVAWILLAEVALYALLTWALSWGLARWMARVAGPKQRTIVVLAIAALLLVVSLFPIYTTPLSTTAPRSNLLGLFE